MTREQRTRAKRVAERLLGTGREVAVGDIADGDTLNAACVCIRTINEQVSELELAKRIYMDEAKRIVAAAGTGATRVVGSDWLLACTQRHSSRIVAEKLLEAGVPLDVVQGATETKVSNVWAVTAKTRGGNG